MARSIVEANLLVLDVGQSVSTKNKDELQSFFDSSCACIVKIIERKIFSRRTDLVGIILSGCDETNNNLANADTDNYQNIGVCTNLQIPSWDQIELVKNNIKTTNNESNWMEALEVALDSIENQLINKKVACKKIVLFSDLKTCPKTDENHVEEVIEAFKNKNVELIVIGPEIWDNEFESEPPDNLIVKSKEHVNSENIMKKIIAELDTIACSFEEAIGQLLYHKNRTVRPTPWNVDLQIGPDISIPVSGFIKIKSVQSIGQWKKCFKNPLPSTNGNRVTVNESANGNQVTVNQSANADQITSVIVKTREFYKKEDNTMSVDELEVINGYVYGQTIVPYTKFEKKMEYESGPRCLKIFGFTKEENIHWGNLIGDGTYFILPRKADENSKIALDAFITTLHNLNLVGICRRVYNNNNAPHMHVLFPIVEEKVKYLSMIELAYKEDYKHMLFPPFRQKKYAYNDDQVKAIDNLIDSMNLSELDEYGEEHFSIEKTINPSLQHTFDTIAYRALYPDKPLPNPRPEIMELLEVPPTIMKLASEPLEEVKKHFELIVKEKVQGGNMWINQQLKSEDNASVQNDFSKPSTSEGTPLSALPAVTSEVTVISTVNPSKDFKALQNNGKPFDQLCVEMESVIEDLVLLSVGSDYTKPLSAMTVLRGECVNYNPAIFNKWLSQFKEVLFERHRKDFFELLIENNLGLIHNKENEKSSITESDAVEFQKEPTVVDSEVAESMDSSLIDALFAD